MAPGSAPLPLPVRLARSLRRAWIRLRRGFLRTDGFLLLVFAGTAVAIALLIRSQPQWFPPSSLALIVLVGGFSLSVRSLALLMALTAGLLAWLVDQLGINAVRPGSLIIVGLTAVIIVSVARSRARVGVQGLRGESMLVDLRDRLRAQGELPELPAGWATDVVLRPAGGASFSGDFLVASKGVGRRLEVVLVDVSGKGVDAGTRALLLSGAFGGLLGALPPEEFLAGCNAYLNRQGWDWGFATAVHLTIDLDSGEYIVGSAGHPPAAHFAAGSGTWQLIEASGTALGITEDGDYQLERGILGHGDALMLYTDGLVERPGRDINVGIDKLLGEAERLVPRGFRRGARRLLDALRTGEGDDRALVLIWRS